MLVKCMWMVFFSCAYLKGLAFLPFYDDEDAINKHPSIWSVLLIWVWAAWVPA